MIKNFYFQNLCVNVILLNFSYCRFCAGGAGLYIIVWFRCYLSRISLPPSQNESFGGTGSFFTKSCLFSSSTFRIACVNSSLAYLSSSSSCLIFSIFIMSSSISFLIFSKMFVVRTSPFVISYYIAVPWCRSAYN